MSEVQQYHYIAIDGFGWACSEDLQTAINNRAEDSGMVCNMNVYFIPEPDKGSTYDIEYFKPVHSGALLVCTIKVDREINLDQHQAATLEQKS